jgi:hypothetical protein
MKYVINVPLLWDFLNLIASGVPQKEKRKKKNRKLTLPTERPPLVGEVGASFCG